MADGLEGRVTAAAAVAAAAAAAAAAPTRTRNYPVAGRCSDLESHAAHTRSGRVDHGFGGQILDSCATDGIEAELL